MESLSLCLSSSPPLTTHRPTKTHLNSLHLRAALPTNSNSNNLKTPKKPPPNFTLIPLLTPLLLSSPPLPSSASELTEQSPDKINLESIVVAMDDFTNRNPFFVAGVTFIWLVVIPLIKAYLRKYKFISAIDAFRKLRDDPCAQLLDIRDDKSLAFLATPNLKILNKESVQIRYSEADEDGFLKKVLGSFPNPPNTVLCIMDNFDGNSFKVAEMLYKKGFKTVYAIRGGIAGKKGWQEIQEELLPPAVHVNPKKKKKGNKSKKGGNGAITRPIEDKIGVSTSSSDP
ncbi:hypothetical protein V2J09_022069 [Rumex salicifolius]